MDKFRKLFQRSRRATYEPLVGSPRSDDHEIRRPEEDAARLNFSWIEYAIFVLLGVAMLWAWNMFLAAAPYFQRRFRANKTLLSNFQATEISVSTLTNLSCMVVLAKLQANASYPRRIAASLIIYFVGYILLATSTKAFINVSGEAYFTFFVIMVFISSIATAFMQNGTFAFASGFDRPEYMQAIMFGQAIAGVLPPVLQIASVLSAGEAADAETAERHSSTAAFAYFLTATCISGLTLLAFLYLVKRNDVKMQTVSTVTFREDGLSQSDDESSATADESAELRGKKRYNTVPLRTLGRKLVFPATAVFITFAVTMIFPVFTQRITSNDPSTSPLFHDAAFIPFGFLVWNAGDLLGRMIPLAQGLSLALRPRILLLLALLRFAFIPLYLLCNISRKPKSPESAALASVKSDIFYLVIVQLPFGISNGYLGSCCMMGAGNCVNEDEREPAGGFMGLFLVGGLAVGSLCSFFIGNAI